MSLVWPLIYIGGALAFMVAAFFLGMRMGIEEGRGASSTRA